MSSGPWVGWAQGRVVDFWEASYLSLSWEGDAPSQTEFPQWSHRKLGLQRVSPQKPEACVERPGRDGFCIQSCTGSQQTNPRAVSLSPEGATD